MTSTDLFSPATGSSPDGIDDEGIPRDQWGRYLLPHLESGRQMPWTRATTFAKTIADTFALNLWNQRMTAAGLAMRPDLLAAVAATPKRDKAKLNALCDEAKDAAGSKVAANLGTALHTFTENADRGEPGLMPDPWDRYVAAYTEAMKRSGLVTVPEYIEKQVVVGRYSVAGTFDRILWDEAAQEFIVGDLKTGRDLDYGWGEIVVQLALYANADRIWDRDAKAYAPMPAPLNKTRAVIIHLPVATALATEAEPAVDSRGKPIEAGCTLYDIDIAAGWEAAAMCDMVRGWRKVKSLAKVRQGLVPVLDAGQTYEGVETAPVKAKRTRKAAAPKPETPAGWPATLPEAPADKPAETPEPAAAPPEPEVKGSVRPRTEEPAGGADAHMRWAKEIREASSRADLSKIWKAATAAGQWTELLEQAGKKRMRELG